MYGSLHQYSYGGLIGYKNQNVIQSVSGTTTLNILNKTGKIYDFKLWVPPGTFSLNVSQYFTTTSSDTTDQFSFVVRKNQEPESAPKTIETDVKSLNNTGFSFNDLNKGVDCFGKNSKDLINFIYNSSSIMIEEGFWIYIGISKVGKIDLELTDISTINVVDVLKYKEWFESVIWMADGDPTFDAAGDYLINKDLPPDAFRTIEITFSPTENKVYDGNAIFVTDIGDFTYGLKGTGYGGADTGGTGGTGGSGGSDTNTALIPTASVLASEFYNYQDLDNNSLVYGYDFKIEDDTQNKPPKKPIILCILERSPYWVNPSKIITWSNFVNGILTFTDGSVPITPPGGSVPTTPPGGTTDTGGTRTTYPDYLSVHQVPVSFYYGPQDKSGEREFEQYCGFKNLYDLTNPIVACDIMYDNQEMCDISKEQHFPLRTLVIDSTPSRSYGQFKVFVPPGCTRVYIYLSVYQSETSTGFLYVAAARLGQPPAYVATGNSTYADYESTEGCKLSDIVSEDYIGRNSSGYLHIVVDNAPIKDDQTTYIPFSNFGWVYCDIYIEGLSSAEYQVKFSLDVSVTPYLEWYKSFKNWEPNGDPWETK